MTNTLTRMTEIEEQIVPLALKKQRLERYRSHTESRYREALATKDKNAAARLDSALSRTAVLIQEVLRQLNPLNQNYRALQRSLIF
jgi:hypothetical protein